jgi:peroxiredoxin
MKNILKSIFISVFPLIAIYLLVTSISILFKEPISMYQSGKILSSFSVIIFFTGLFLKPQARTSRNLNGFTLPVFIGLLVGLIGFIVNKNSLHFDLFVFFLLIISWITYLKWYSVFENRLNNSILKIGAKLPNFELENSNKLQISSSTFIGNFSIFLFYRGNWCPLCMAQIKEIVAQYKEIEKRGIHMILVSPQPHSFSEALAKKHKVPFHFLTDKNNTVAEKLGIFHKAGLPAGFQILGYETDTVMPTVIITDKKEKIIYIDETDNYRVRPEPETFFNIIDNQN